MKKKIIPMLNMIENPLSGKLLKYKLFRLLGIMYTSYITIEYNTKTNCFIITYI